MEQEENKKTASRELMEKIKKGEIKKRPKIYFILKNFLYGFGILASILCVLVLGSFVLFILRITGLLFLPRFGMSGFRIFFSSFPWFFIIVLTGLVLLIESFAKRSRLVYQKPLLYSLVVLMSIVVLGIFILNRATLHERLFERAQENKLPPPVGSLYRDYGTRQIKNTFICQVKEVTDGGLKVIDKDGREIRVTFPAKIRYLIEEGDTIIIFGELRNGEISALGLTKFNNGCNSPWCLQNQRCPGCRMK